MRCFYNKERV